MIMDVIRLVRWLKPRNLSLYCNHLPSTAFRLTHAKLIELLISAQAGRGSQVHCLLSALSCYMEHVVEHGDPVVRIAQTQGSIPSSFMTVAISPQVRADPLGPRGSTKPMTHTFAPWETVSMITAQHRILAQESLAANPGVNFQQPYSRPYSASALVCR